MDEAEDFDSWAKKAKNLLLHIATKTKQLQSTTNKRKEPESGEKSYQFTFEENAIKLKKKKPPTTIPHERTIFALYTKLAENPDENSLCSW